MPKFLIAAFLFCFLTVSFAEAAIDLSKPLDLKFTAVDGRQVDLVKLRGKVVLIDFWATWCPPCRAIAPDIAGLYQKYHGQGFEVIGISADSDKAALLDFVKKEGAPWPQFFGENGDTSIFDRFEIQQYPTLWLIDKKGMVVTTDFFNLWLIGDEGLRRVTSAATKEKIAAAVEKQLKMP